MTGVWLAPIGKKNFVVGNVYATITEHGLCDRRAHKIVTHRRSIALKALANCQIINAFAQRGHGNFWKRLGDIANAAANHLQRKLWIRVAKNLDSTGNFRKQIARV